MSNFVAPTFKATAFNCPLCNAYAQQRWTEPHYFVNVFSPIKNLVISTCYHCSRDTFWIDKKAIYPNGNGVAPPNPDLPEKIIEIYNEAASIANASPRGSAALLRLALQELCIELGQPGKDLNKDIGNLVKEGLPPKIQKSFDIVRIVGNNAVHPGEIDLKDNPDVALKLFQLINIIAEQIISTPNLIDKQFNDLPEGPKKGIEKRDS